MFYAIAFGIGVGFSALSPVPPVAWAGVVPVLAFLFFVFHKRRKHSFLFLSSCFSFFAAGLVRGQFGDVTLLPPCAYGYAARVLGWLVARMHSLGLSDEASSLLDAMLLGQRNDIPSEMWWLYSNAGAAHVLALSGLHLGILCGIFHYCLMRVLPCAPVRCALGVFEIICVWGFTFVTGLPMSLVRAAIMLSLYTVSWVRLCGFDRWHTLGLSAFLILLVAPSSLWSKSFQLSFSAMTGIFLLFSPLCDLLNVRSWPLRWLRNGVVVSFAAQVFCLPLVLHHFGRVSPYSVVFSVFYVLIAVFILLLGLIILAYGSGLAPVVSGLVWTQHWLMRLVAELPGAVYYGLRVSWAQVAVAYVVMFCVVFLFVERRRRCRLRRLCLWAGGVRANARDVLYRPLCRFPEVVVR